jgi:fibronectin type 3 domain-containing protein
MGVVSAIISAAAATWGGVAIGTAATASTFLGLSAVGSFLARAAIGVALYALQPKPNTGSANRGYQVTTRGSAVDHQIVYGEAKVGGVVVFDGTTGTNNKFLHRVLAFTGHEIEAFSDIYINDSRVTDLEVDGNVKEVTDPDGTTSDRYDGKMRINKHLGETDQSADSDLVSEVAEWTNDHRLRGVSYLYVRFKFDQDAYPNGVPEVTAVVKGKKVYDPRSDTTAWSDNPALCLRDYLSEGYGLNEADANIDDTLVTTAANVCDETTSVSGATRYTCNGSFTTGATPYDTLNAMLTSMGGLLWYAQGEWRMKAADYVAPSVVFTEDDLRSNIQVATRHSRRDNFNTVKGTFRGEESDWQVTDYPEVSNASFVTIDGGQESVMDLDLPFTDTSGEARRLALIALERNRQQLTVNASFGLKAFKVQVGDIVQLSIDRFGWTQKEFEVISWTFGLTDGLDLQAQMTLREISESVFDEIDDGIVYERDNTTLLSPFDVPQPALNAPTVTTTVNEDGTTVPEILFSWGVSSDEVIDHYDFQWKLTSETNYKTTNLTGTEFLLTPAISGASYDYRVRASNSFGVNSPFTSSVSPVSTGDDGTTPNAPSNLVADAGIGSVKLTWDEPTQNTDGSSIKDLFQYRVFRNTSNNFAGASLVGRISSTVLTDSSLTGGQTYYYWVTAVDYTGNESSESSVASASPTEPETRGGGTYYIGVTTLPTTSSGAHTDFTNAIGDPVDFDRAWFYTGTIANPTAQSVWIYEEGSGATPADSWNEQEEVIDGDLLVTGSVTAAQIAISDETAADRVEIVDNKILIYDNNVLRVKIGDLS